MSALIAECLPLFFAPDDVLEVRALDVGRPGRKVAGYLLARNIPVLAGRIADVAAEAGGVYFTPQRLDPAVLGRARHHIAEVVKVGDETRPRLTLDADVLGRRYLLIDVDPERPAAHKKDSATDAEKAAAWDVLTAVRAYMAGHRWAAPLAVDSGNGYHLYYRLPEPEPGGAVADPSLDPLASLLWVMKARFDTAAAKIDQTVYNAARIMKVPGTVARKGTPTADRPHRPCRVLEVPHDWRA